MINPIPRPITIRASNKLGLPQIFVLVSIFLFSGCSSAQGNELPTAVPPDRLPTVIALTLDASGELTPPSQTPHPVKTDVTQRTAPPTSSSLSSPLTSTPTHTPPVINVPERTTTPTIMPTALPDIPAATIQIRSPGPLSRVASPLKAQAYLPTGARGRVLFELLGEDNRILFRQIRVVNSVPAGAYIFLTQDIDFEIPGTAETARFQISVKDEYGRTTALNSVPIILLAIGEADITPTLDMRAPIIIQQPVSKKLIQGGQITVAGLVRSGTEQPLMVQLITTNGREVGSRLAGVGQPGEDGYAPFAVDVTYQVQKYTPVLVVVTQGDKTLNNVIHLTSTEAFLSP